MRDTALSTTMYFHERAAIFDHTVRSALSPPHTSRAPGFATQDHARARDSNAAQGYTQDMEATLGNLFRKECRGCGEARRPSRPPASRIQSSGAIVTSQPWIQLTGGYARWEALIVSVQFSRRWFLPASSGTLTHCVIVCNGTLLHTMMMHRHPT